MSIFIMKVKVLTILSRGETYNNMYFWYIYATSLLYLVSVIWCSNDSVQCLWLKHEDKSLATQILLSSSSGR